MAATSAAGPPLVRVATTAATAPTTIKMATAPAACKLRFLSPAFELLPGPKELSVKDNNFRSFPQANIPEGAITSVGKVQNVGQGNV